MAKNECNLKFTIVDLSPEDVRDLTDTEHCCKMECHLGDCDPCDGITKIKCRCGTNTKVNLLAY